MTDLISRLQTAIDKEKFTHIQIDGFGLRPSLALLAGAVIGYRLALENVDEFVGKPKYPGMVEGE